MIKNVKKHDERHDDLSLMLFDLSHELAASAASQLDVKRSIVFAGSHSPLVLNRVGRSCGPMRSKRRLDKKTCSGRGDLELIETGQQNSSQGSSASAMRERADIRKKKLFFIKKDYSSMGHLLWHEHVKQRAPC